MGKNLSEEATGILPENIHEVEQTSSKFSIFHKMWPSLFAQNVFAFTYSALFINIIYISLLIWPGEEFHAQEFGIMLGLMSWMIAIGGLFFGKLADHFSRKILLGIAMFGFGLGLFFNGFVPEGKGTATYMSFLIGIMIRGFMGGCFSPITQSLANDATSESQRSQFYGILNASFQIFHIIGMIISALFFQYSWWREYFMLTGGIGIIIGIGIFIKAKEPKRGANQAELKEILQFKDTTYHYKLTKETIRSTIFTPTNIIAFLEGLFTTILLGIPDFLIVAYLQSPPLNLSALIISIIFSLTGIPGALLGSLGFSKISDRLGTKNIRNRIFLIMSSMIILFFIFLIEFRIPIPTLSIGEGQQLDVVIQFWQIWVFAGLSFIARLVLTIYNINQPPILQKINLPEAQGLIGSTNQFLEMIGSGIGPMIGGTVLAYFGGNYPHTALITMSIGMIGALLWLIGAKWIQKDSDRISKLLSHRAQEIKKAMHNPQL